LRPEAGRFAGNIACVTNSAEPVQHPGLVIAVDGPAGSGKSSAAREVACSLGLRYLDTGAMYRALTWWLLENGVDIASAAAVRVGGADVAGPIRAREVSNAVSAVASVPQVRAHLIAMQREIIAQAIAAGQGIVAEGRDIGSVVAPEAQVKVFLTASETVRARRRSADLAGEPGVTVALTRAEQTQRDRRDAPQMARAADAVEIDSTGIGLDEVVREIVSLVTSRTAGAAWTS
jgi:cytidylate kinase